jgi:hypothetical protein
MRLRIRQRAGEHERFALDAFASQVGKTIRFNLDEDHSTAASVAAADVVDGGLAVLLTLDVPDDAIPMDHPLRPDVGRMSFGWQPPAKTTKPAVRCGLAGMLKAPQASHLRRWVVN